MNQTEEGKISSNETTENPGFTEFVNNQASRQMRNDLGNLLMPVSQRDENAAKYIGISFEELGEDRVGVMRLTHGINQIVTAKNPEDGKEWEEFLDRFDSLEEAIQELMKEEQERKEAEEAKKENVVIDAVSILLTTESTSCVYETADPDDDDIRYITWYTEEGIFCRKTGQTVGYEWSIVFENKEQYDKIMEFIGQFPSDWNMRFAAHENFWNDFLNEEIDLDGFMEFIKGTNKRIPDFSITVGDSMYVDKDKYMPSVWKSNIKN